MNIDNVMIVEKYGYYDICVEFSRLPVESFKFRSDAYDFVNGYLYGKTYSNAALRGKLFKDFVKMDLNEGITYRKVNELEDVAV